MSRIELISTPYAGRSAIASGQEAINVYAEINASHDPQAPAKTTYYPTPGSVLYADPIFLKKRRASYRTSLDTAFYVVGQNVYFLTSNQILIFIGAIADLPSQIIFSDNGLVATFVDGKNGYVIDLATNTLGIITDPNFYPADYVTLLDTFFIYNRAGTNQFFISGSNVNYALMTTTGAFDPLDIAAKSGFNDPIVGIVAVHRELWLIGNLTTEVWIGTGAADFYFQEQQGAYINHGCAAQFSIATIENSVLFIMQDKQGNGIVIQGDGYTLTEISTPRLVSIFKDYVDLTDAVGFCFQIVDHAFYALVFANANAGWLYDLTTKQWSEWGWTDGNGVLNRPRANCYMFVYNANLVGDWENGKLLKLDINEYQEYGASPIVCTRTFPHITDAKYSRISGLAFDADMQVGTIEDDGDPQVSLSWSDDKGVSYGNPVMQSLSKTGKFLTTISWNRLGQARDRVYKLSWAANCKTALNGGFIDSKAAKT